jgi:site-specific recombinase XerD
MTRQHAWRLIQQYAEAASVLLPDQKGALRPATGLHFRHGAAVHQLRAGVPLTEVQQQLGHARIDTTTIYTKLTSSERRSYADRVEW